MAFTFLYLSLFSSWFFFFNFLFFFLEIPNTFFSRRFQPVLQFPALLSGTEGWSLGGGAEPPHVLLRPILWRVSILDLLGGLAEERLPNEGLGGKSCPPCTALLFLLSSKIFRGQKCRFVLAVLA